MKLLFDIVGMRFRGAEEFVRARPVGTLTLLTREPDNPHDRNAVKVSIMDGGVMRHVGYVKATQAASLARDMDRLGVREASGSIAAYGDRPSTEVEWPPARGA